MGTCYQALESFIDEDGSKCLCEVCVRFDVDDGKMFVNRPRTDLSATFVSRSV